METLFTSVTTIISKMIELLGTITLALLKNWIFLLMIGIVILGIIIGIIFKMVKKTFYWNGKRIKGYAHWQPTGRYAEMGSEPVRISKREYKRLKKRGEEVSLIVDMDDSFDYNEEDDEFYF